MMREQGRDRVGEKPKKGMRRTEGGRGGGTVSLARVQAAGWALSWGATLNPQTVV